MKNVDQSDERDLLRLLKDKRNHAPVHFGSTGMMQEIAATLPNKPHMFIDDLEHMVLSF